MDESDSRTRTTAQAPSEALFVTFEGVDGAGKSTHIRFVEEQLRARGRRVVVTREPGGTPLAEELRRIVLETTMDPVAETLIMFAARADHLNRVIRPALKAGLDVLCDRFTDATLAYQGAGKGVSSTLIGQLALAVHPDLAPSVSFVFDCDWETSQSRIERSGRTRDRFEQENRDFFERVRAAYRRLANAEPGRVRPIDATGSIDDVRGEILRALSELRL